VPPWPTTPPTAAELASFAEAEPRPFWLDALPSREPDPPLRGRVDADLCVVGGGFTGLWAALHALKAEPSRRVVVLEAERIAWGGSGRNGGFVSSSLTHGIANGMARVPAEMEALERLGLENFAGMRADLEAEGIDAGWEETGELAALLDPHELDAAEEEAAELRTFGHDVEVLGEAAMRAEVDSPTYLGGVWDRTGCALVDPARVAEGLRAAVLARGARVHERTRVAGLREDGDGMEVACDGGAAVSARRVLLATGASPPLLRRVRAWIAPVYDYVLMTEPLSAAQKRAIGWERRQGMSDAGNRFHYYRLTADDRILWGGFEAVYRFRGPVAAKWEQDDGISGLLAQHFFTTFPQLEGLRFSHRWGGAIDTCSRFSAFWGTAYDGRVAYAAGYTGLGVGASRFGARVALDLLDGRDTEATRLKLVRTKPVPFPPEPIRTGVIQLTRNRLAAADVNGGRRGLWLRTLDRLGLGFDS
jgi:glycine/D-amino acid oxidase-like deaminating enzyme